MPHGTNRRTMLTSKGALFHHCLVVGGLRWIEITYQLFRVATSEWFLAMRGGRDLGPEIRNSSHVAAINAC
jgi:hypothetical protein